MPSLQQSAPGSKSAKFVAVNPLEPMVNPFGGGAGSYDENSNQQLVDSVNERLQRTVQDLKDRRGPADDPERAPTGPSYRQMQQQQQKLKRSEQERLQNEKQQEIARVQLQMKNQRTHDDDEDSGSEEDSDSDYDDLLDDDEEAVLAAIRQKRLAEMRQAHNQKIEDLARGHGQYRTITETEFLPECTGGSEWVAVHFFHREFQRCHIMDKHLKVIAPLHTTCKFVRIDAEKAPFFVAKLQVKTLPTLILFRHGKATARLTGFDGLSTDSKNPDEFSTRRLQEWLDETGAIEYTPSREELADDMERLGLSTQRAKGSSSIRRGVEQGAYNDED